jgi:hypothetical protein
LTCPGLSCWIPKTAALVQIGALVAIGAPGVCLEWGTTRALAAGATEDEITGVLLAVAICRHISPPAGSPIGCSSPRHTVETQVKSLHRKLGVTSRNDAVQQATAVGLLSG